MIDDVLILGGWVCLLVGGYWLSPPVGLMVLGGGLMVAGVARIKNGHSKEYHGPD